MLIFWLSMVVGWTYTLDCDSPLGTDAPSTIDDKIRETRDGYQERLNVDHYFALTGSSLSDSAIGQHRQIEFYGPISTPSDAANKSWLYSKDVSSKTEFHWLDEDGNELQITNAGTLNISSDDLLGTLTNETYFTAVNAAGDGTVDLIKANSSDVAVLPDGSEMASTTAPTADADISNKKYVDDQVDASSADGYTPTSYTGGESITFPNGLILKHGSGTADGVGDATISFGTAFPHAIVSVTVSSSQLAGWVSNVLVSGFDFDSAGTSNTYYWQAWGY